MIKNVSAYKKTLKDISLQEKHIQDEKLRFRQMGLREEQVEEAIQPLVSFLENLKDDAIEYEEIKAGNFEHLTKLPSIGKLLVAGRIFKEINQGELANRLGVAESQISRDEKNEYYGASVEKLISVATALEIEIEIGVNIN